MKYLVLDSWMYGYVYKWSILGLMYVYTLICWDPCLVVMYFLHSSSDILLCIYSLVPLLVMVGWIYKCRCLCSSSVQLNVIDGGPMAQGQIVNLNNQTTLTLISFVRCYIAPISHVGSNSSFNISCRGSNKSERYKYARQNYMLKNKQNLHV